MMPGQPPPPAGAPAPGGPPAVAQQGPPPVTIDAVVQLLRDDEMRGFRIDVETDSMIEPDHHAEQASRTEFVTAVGQFLVQLGPIVQVMPALTPMVAGMLQFAVRGYKVGQDLEELIEKTMEDVGQALGQPKPPPPPSPDEQVKFEGTKVKTAAEIQKANLAVQEAQLKAQSDQITRQHEIDQRQRDHAAEMEAARQQIEHDRERHTLEMQRADQKHAHEMDRARQDHELSMVAGQADQERKQQDAAASIAAKGAPAEKPDAQPKGDDTSHKLLALLTQAMLAPKKVIRDAKGDITGVGVA